MVDANSDPDARWRSITDRLQTLGIETSANPHPDGTVLEGLPRIGIWLMADNVTEGQLEDFVANMIPDNDPVWPLSQDYIDSIPTEHRKFGETKVSRAKVHAWLAARDDPRQMGAAIGARDLDIDGDLCTRFTDWLDRLFT